MAGLAHIVLLDPDTPQAFHWSRTPAGAWRHELVEGLHRVVELPEFSGVLDLTTLYAGLTFVPRPRLVRDGEAESESR